MKIKRYFASDMRRAIGQVRLEQGPDAVILSNRNVEGGVEIVAAIDYDERQVHEQMKQIDEPTEKKKPRQDNVSTLRPKTKQLREAVLTTEKQSRKRQTKPAKAPIVSAIPKESSAGKRETSAQSQSILQMREELQSMRQMLESQLSDLSWQVSTEREPIRIELLGRLMKLGLGPALARELADNAMAQTRDKTKLEAMWRASLQSFSQKIAVIPDELLSQGGVYALVGPTGVGKTTTIAKLAAHFALRHGHQRVALITTDQYRVGGHEQLLNYARILDIPVRSAQNAQELQTILNSTADKHLRLIDTSGLSHKDDRLPEQLDLLCHMDQDIRKLLVLSSTTAQVGCREIVKTYQQYDLMGGILTKMDESACLAGPLSVMIEHQLALAYVTDGQRVPEDIHQARPHSLVSRSVSVMQRSGEEWDEASMEMVFGSKAAFAYV